MLRFSNVLSGLIISLVLLSGSVRGDEARVISGPFRFQPATTSVTPPEESRWSPPTAYWTAARAPTKEAWGEAKKEDIHSVWMEAVMEVPATQGLRFELDFTRINGNAVVFLNGKRIGERLGPYGRIEITEAVVEGKNVLHLFLTRDYTDVSRTFETDLLRYVTRGPRSIRGEVPMHQWSLGINSPFYLVSYPKTVGLTDAWVETGVREKNITLHVEIANDGKPGDLSLECEILDAEGKTALAFPAQAVRPERDKDVITLRKDWANPRLWEIEAPYLYRAVVRIRSGNQVVDTRSFTFGFREVWTEGRHLVLNGHVQRLRLDWSQNGFTSENGLSLLKMLRRNAVYYQSNPSGWWRNWWGEVYYFPPEELELMDRNGIAVFLPVPPVNCGRELFFDNSEFVAQYRKELAEFIRRYRNHPSILAWCISMNSFCPRDGVNAETIGQRVDYGATQGKVLNAMTELAHEVDPTRLAYGHADGNTGDIASGNTYPNMTPLQEVEDYPERFSQKGDMPWWACEYGLYNGTLYKGRQFLLTEYAAINFGPEAYRRETDALRAKIVEIGLANQNGHAKDLEKYIDLMPMYWELERAFYRSTNRAWRTYGVLAWHYFDFGIGYGTPPGKAATDRWQDRYKDLKEPVTQRPDWANPAFDYNREYMSPLLLYVGGHPHHTDKTHLFYGEERFTKNVVAVWDGPGETTFQGEVALKVGNRVVKTHKIEATLAPGEIRELPVEFAAPRVAERTDGMIVLTATDSKGEAVEEQFVLTFFPKPEPLKLPMPVRLFDPGGRSGWVRDVLDGVRPLAVGEQVAPGELLIVGREALQVGGDLPCPAETLEAGARIVVLEQKPEVFEAMGFRTIEAAPRVLFPNSPLVKALPEDLRYWRGTPDLTPEFKHARTYDVTIAPKTSNRNVIASVVIENPLAVGFVPLVHGEFDLNYAALLQFKAGKGQVLFSTFDFSDRVPADPAATRMAQNIFRIAVEQVSAERAVYAPPQARKELEGIRLEIADGKFDVAPVRSLLVAANDDKVNEKRTEKFLEEGGKALWINADMAEKRGWKTRPAKVFHAAVPDDPTPIFSPNLWRWRDALDVRQVTAETVLADGLYARQDFENGASETLLQVSPGMLDNRYTDAPDQREAIALSIVRLRQLLSQVLTDQGARPAPEVTERILKTRKGLAFRPLDNWFVFGPFPAQSQKPDEALNVAYPGQQQALAGDMNPNYTYDNGAGRSLDFRKTANADPKGFIDLARATGADAPNTVAYAIKLIPADKDYKAMIRLGADYYFQLYVNGKLSYEQTQGHGPPKPNDVRARINLKKGENVLVLKVMAGSNGFGFWADMSEPGKDYAEAQTDASRELLYDPSIKLRSPYEYHYW